MFLLIFGKNQKDIKYLVCSVLEKTISHKK